MVSICLLTPLHWEGFFLLFLPTTVVRWTMTFFNAAIAHRLCTGPGKLQNSRINLVPRWVQIVLCNQNLHLVHHLAPKLPWYLYPKFWELNKNYLRRQGSVIKDFRGQTSTETSSEDFLGANISAEN